MKRIANISAGLAGKARTGVLPTTQAEDVTAQIARLIEHATTTEVDAVVAAVAALQPCALRAVAGRVLGNKDHPRRGALWGPLGRAEAEGRVVRFASPGGWRWRLP